jgi:hypothetical protein
MQKKFGIAVVTALLASDRRPLGRRSSPYLHDYVIREHPLLLKMEVVSTV